MDTTTISAQQWLEVRDRVAAEIRAAHRIEPQNGVKIAEALLKGNFIDVPAVLETIAQEKKAAEASLASS